MMTVDELDTCERLAQFYADEKLCANIIQSHILLRGSLSTEARDTIKRIEKMGKQTIKILLSASSKSKKAESRLPDLRQVAFHV